MRFLLLLFAASVLAKQNATWQRRSYALDLGDHSLSRRQSSDPWTLTQPGTTGVGAMQLVVVSPTQALILDKVQHNPLMFNGHNAWSTIYSLVTNTVRPVSLLTNSFCAGGSFLGNGTLVSVGGNVVAPEVPGDGDGNGAQGLRLFDPSSCADDAPACAFYEDPSRIHITSSRWYPTTVKLDDGA